MLYFSLGLRRNLLSFTGVCRYPGFPGDRGTALPEIRPRRRSQVHPSSAGLRDAPNCPINHFACETSYTPGHVRPLWHAESSLENKLHPKNVSTARVNATSRRRDSNQPEFPNPTIKHSAVRSEISFSIASRPVGYCSTGALCFCTIALCARRTWRNFFFFISLFQLHNFIIVSDKNERPVFRSLTSRFRVQR